MNKSLLVRYIRMTLAEDAAQARVPNQLIPSDDVAHADDEQEADVNEFSGVGSIAGYSAPLGADPDKLGRKKNASKHSA